MQVSYLINGELLAAEILLEQLIVLFGDVLNELIMILLCKFTMFWNILNSDVETLVIIVDISLHLNKVDDSQSASRLWGELNRNCVTLQALLHHVYNIIEVSSHNVHLVNIDHSRNLVLVRLSPDGFGLGLNAALAQRTVTEPSRTRRERSTSTVKSTWPGVSMMLDSVVLPEAGNASEAFAIPSFPCSCSIQSIMQHHHALAEFAGLSCVEQDTLRCGGFACVNMRYDSDIPGLSSETSLGIKTSVSRLCANSKIYR